MMPTCGQLKSELAWSDVHVCPPVADDLVMPDKRSESWRTFARRKGPSPLGDCKLDVMLGEGLLGRLPPLNGFMLLSTNLSPWGLRSTVGQLGGLLLVPPSCPVPME